MAILVFLEYEGNNLRPSSYSAVQAATLIGEEVHAFLAGTDSTLSTEVVGAACRIKGLKKVLLCKHEAFGHMLAEPLAAQAAALAENYTHILAASSSVSRAFMPRLAALLDVQPISDVVAIQNPTTFKRPMYAGSVMATVCSHDEKQVLTIRHSSFGTAEKDSEQVPVEPVEIADLPVKTEFVSVKLSESERPELENARVVISGGRGLQNEENFHLLEPLADKLNAAIGASRAAVDAGYVSNEYQVGQTGKIVAPELYIAIGISGAIQHIAGIKESRVIVAINKDPDAPIFQVADYGMVGDLFEILPKLEKII
ncbi:electron transfer flavoprotein subunit alpha/FixB family protein [Entomobacter blattae]|uniref:Electron transfer flavoprotein subunit alpha n=1 Tax=Entomobacter blattae TaxID=2762277 RepID=A0A7H1NPS8_9PROT|nr:FAD-binding protein [Entomobacter blattae]QNT77788.1 Electron transfer flavoprotein subunit alpha [Entomobacter blattae]